MSTVCEILTPLSMDKRYLDELYQLFTKIRTKKEAEMLLKDILTPQELDSVAERWQLIKRLSKGLPQREISKDLKISIAKVSRGSRALKYGTGGFDLFLKR